MEELLLYSFCGNKVIRWESQYHDEIEKYGKLYRPFCVSCGGACRGVKSKKKAVEAWNKRVIQNKNRYSDYTL